ncbi:hypothetical protein AX774_g269 [Zancudomyces culisetae]|uniref:Uncharacterized protein n=1 Tax=Zancudomyces culisetae TaxID=1213189 RepID=A0A1R1PYX4_ZANCU|nr:hypothetical protein AX774_g269 [Zancudomyces culisetae]|eukprot:OMH86155.1 hypothetical protein AX774_g269 [Zancudomyces culisetae]
MLNEDTLKDTNSNHPLSELEFHLNYITMLKKRFEVERASITSPQDKKESQADNIFKVVGDESTEKTCAHPRIVELN